jgi:acyl-CoA synthetase (AMP-forming)/AMP-acid ligase II
LRAKEAMPHVNLIQCYGMTELGGAVTYLDTWRDIEADAARMFSAGRACEVSEIQIARADGSEAPRGEIGQILVRGPNVMLRYWEKPNETSAALRDGWLHSGDAAYMDEAGYIFIVDRLKDMIVSGGENIYSAEVENVITRHAAVLMCAVIGIPNPQWGETVHAVVVRKPGLDVSAGMLMEFCREHIGGYKVPRSVEFRDSLPLTGPGKIAKVKLREAFAST